MDEYEYEVGGAEADGDELVVVSSEVGDEAVDVFEGVGALETVFSVESLGNNVVGVTADVDGVVKEGVEEIEDVNVGEVGVVVNEVVSCVLSLEV